MSSFISTVGMYLLFLALWVLSFIMLQIRRRAS